MGYELHITRASDWLNSEESPIALDEWREYVASDMEMRLDGFAEAESPDGAIIRYENSGLAVWTAYSGHGRDGNMAWFDFRNGRIVVKHPDEEIIEKMKRIAAHFGANIFGDEGESYYPPIPPANSKRSWWKFW